MSKAFNPRRSVLFVPGSDADKLERARSLSCDVVVLDLEDSVAPDNKEKARAAVLDAIGNYPGREVVVRINPLATSLGEDDLAAIKQARPHAVLLPKVARAQDVIAAGAELPVWAMVETPLAVLNLGEIAASGASCLVLGTNDLLKAMHAQPLSDRHNLWAVMTATVIAARAHGLCVLDGTHNDIGDLSGFAEACAQARAFGFDGKTLIHPLQIVPCNRAFAPSLDEIAEARRIIEAFAGRPEKGAIALDGRMIERLHVEEAQRLLALAQAIEGRA